MITELDTATHCLRQFFARMGVRREPDITLSFETSDEAHRFLDQVRRATEHDPFVFGDHGRVVGGYVLPLGVAFKLRGLNFKIKVEGKYIT